MWYAAWIDNSDIAFTDDLWVTDVSMSLCIQTRFCAWVDMGVHVKC